MNAKQESPSATSPQTSYEPLSRELIEQIRHYGTHIIGYEKRAETVITLCDMAINALLYAEEIQRLRDTPSETRVPDEFVIDCLAGRLTTFDQVAGYISQLELRLQSTPSATRRVEPVAWAIVEQGSNEVIAAFPDEQAAITARPSMDHDTIPLFATPSATLPPEPTQRMIDAGFLAIEQGRGAKSVWLAMHAEYVHGEVKS